jgi:hypothetical protein
MSFKSGRLSASRKAVLTTNLAMYNTSRGAHSWGVVAINNDGAQIKRGLGRLADSSYELCDHNTLFAHTRHATTGDPENVKNAHPFRVGKILGAHNGMVFNHEEMNEKYKRKFEVDSQHLFAHLNEGKAFKELHGYGAIEWMREGSKTIHLCKLLGGELCIYGIGDEKNTDGIVWSSDYRHLQRALLAAGLLERSFRYETRRGKVYDVINGELSVNGRKLELGMPPVVKEEAPAENDQTENDNVPIWPFNTEANESKSRTHLSRRPFTYDLIRAAYSGTRTEI